MRRSAGFGIDEPKVSWGLLAGFRVWLFAVQVFCVVSSDAEAGVHLRPLWEMTYQPGRGNASGHAVAVYGNRIVGIGLEAPEPGGRNAHWLVIVYDREGRLLWARTQGSSFGDGASPSSVAVDKAGSIFASGGEGYRAGGYGWLVVKYDLDGKAVWRWRPRSLEGREDTCYAVKPDGSGGCYVVGMEQSRREQAVRGVIIRLDSRGHLMWRRVHVGPGGGDAAIVSAAKLGTDGIVVLGAEAPLNNRYGRWWLARYRHDGELVWAGTRSGGEQVVPAPARVAVGRDGMVIAVGEDRSGPSLGRSRWVLLRYTASGELVWAKDHEVPKGVARRPSGLAVDGAGRIILCGSVESADNGGAEQIALFRYASDGEPTRSSGYRTGVAAAFRATDMAIDPFGNIAFVGSTEYRKDRVNHEKWITAYLPKPQ